MSQTYKVMRRNITFSLLAFGIAAAALFAQATPSQLETFLKKQLGFTALEIADLERGRNYHQAPSDNGRQRGGRFCNHALAGSF